MSDQQAHALFSPSSAHKWMECIGALAMEDGLPSTTNRSAEEGTAAHELAAWALTDGAFYCDAYLGRITSNDWEVTEEMCEYVQIYVDAIRSRVEEYYAMGAVKVTLLVENRIEFSELVNVKDQFGTSDAIFLVEWADGTALVGVEDLKYGYHIVHAEYNKQLMVYALAVLEQYGLLANFTRARMVIHQPRRDHVSDWEISVDELLAFGAEVTLKAQQAYRVLQGTREKKQMLGTKTVAVAMKFLTPGEKQCHYCKRNGDCPALAKWTTDLIANDFEDLTKANITEPLDNLPVLVDDQRGQVLAKYLKAMPLLEIFAKGILSAAEAFLFDGGKIPGYKVVPGKKGHRKYRDPKEAEDLFKSMRLKLEQMYSFKLKSPTQIEKLLKKESPRRWKKVEELIVQNEGQPSIAEDADPREPLTINNAVDDFDVVVDGDDLA